MAATAKATIHEVATRHDVEMAMKDINTTAKWRIVDMVWTALQYFKEITVLNEEGEGHTLRRAG